MNHPQINVVTSESSRLNLMLGIKNVANANVSMEEPNSRQLHVAQTRSWNLITTVTSVQEHVHARQTATSRCEKWRFVNSGSRLPSSLWNSRVFAMKA